MSGRSVVATVLVALAIQGGSASAEDVNRSPTSVAAGSPSSAPIPFKADSESTSDLAVRVLIALFACAMVGVGGIYLLRSRRWPGLSISPSRRLQVLETQRIGVKSSVVLLRWDQEELLLVQSEGRTELLARKAMINGRDEQSVVPQRPEK